MSPTSGYGTMRETPIRGKTTPEAIDALADRRKLVRSSSLNALELARRPLRGHMAHRPCALELRSFGTLSAAARVAVTEDGELDSPHAGSAPVPLPSVFGHEARRRLRAYTRAALW